jgi:hypothetical protein
VAITKSEAPNHKQIQITKIETTLFGI